MKEVGSLKTTNEHYLKVIHLITDANINFDSTKCLVFLKSAHLFTQ